MAIANEHNLHQPLPPAHQPYGIRVRLPAGDSFSALLGNEWQREHWYASATERDAAILEMGRKHEFSRPGDRPTLRCERIQKL